MRAYLIDNDYDETELTGIVSWDICHTSGEPCDCFEVTAVYSELMLGALADAVKFRAEHDGECVFVGVVDEYIVSAKESGAVMTVNGRSLAAYLLDNEAEAAEYANVSLSDIIRDHVTPLGISMINSGTMPRLEQFTVSSGQSRWSVLKHFCRYAANVQPRFSPDGVLILKNLSGTTYAVSDAYSLKFRSTRYGIISSVLVKNRVTGASYTVNNTGFSGSSGRVLTVPKYTGAEAARYTAEYQIQESSREKRCLELVVPRIFPMFPGDRASISYEALGLSGIYRVIRTRCWADEKSAGTVITVEV